MFKPLLSRVTALAVGLALVLALISGIVWSNVSQQKGSELVRHTMEVESRLYRLLTLLEDAETGQRGYLLTSDESYLAPYLTGAAALDGEFKNLAALISDNPRQDQSLSTLINLTKERLALLKESIDHQRKGERDQALDVIRSGVGKAVMDRARDNISQMVVEEERLLDIRQRDLERTTQWLFAGMLLVVILVITLALIAIANERRQTLGLAASRDFLALANERL